MKVDAGGRELFSDFHFGMDDWGIWRLNFNDMKLLNASFPRRTWPTAKDQLFKEDSDWQCNAHLNLGGKDSGAYSAGYKNAADLLARRFLRNWRGNDILVYPMVFLYRQFIELRLKEIIELGQELLDEPVNIQSKILEDHKLRPLQKS